MARLLRVAVIGGGIGGLAAARALLLRGMEVTVFEQAPRLSEFGGGVVLTPNALTALRALGLEARVLADAFESRSQVVRSWRSQPLDRSRTMLAPGPTAAYIAP